MKQATHEMKMETALAQSKAVAKAEKKHEFLYNKDARKYVKQRQTDLKKVRGY